MTDQPLNAVLEELAELIAQRVADHLRHQHSRTEAIELSPWMSVETAAVYLDWPKQRLYKLTAAGRIPHCRHDGRLVFHRDELDHWLQGFAQGTRE